MSSPTEIPVVAEIRMYEPMRTIHVVVAVQKAATDIRHEARLRVAEDEPVAVLAARQHTGHR